MNSDTGKTIVSKELEGILPEDAPLDEVDNRSKLVIKYSGDEVVTISCNVSGFDGVNLDIDNIPARVGFEMMKSFCDSSKDVHNITLTAYGQEFDISSRNLRLYGVYDGTCCLSFSGD